jgi:hypothetical protein
VATLISERVDAETASQQLGHSSPAVTREFYISKPAIAADVEREPPLICVYTGQRRFRSG